MSHPSRTKTQGGDRFSRNRPFSAQGRNLWAGWSDSPAQKLLARSWTGPENFIKILSFHQKLFNFLIRTDRHTDRHTDRQTHEPPSIYGRAKFFYACFWYLFTSLRSLRSLRSWRIIIKRSGRLGHVSNGQAHEPTLKGVTLKSTSTHVGSSLDPNC